MATTPLLKHRPTLALLLVLTLPLSCWSQTLSRMVTLNLLEVSNGSASLTMGPHYLSFEQPGAGPFSDTFKPVSEAGLQTLRTTEGQTFHVLFNAHLDQATERALVLYSDAKTFRVFDNDGSHSPFFGPVDHYAQVSATSGEPARLSDFSLGNSWIGKGGVGEALTVGMRSDVRNHLNLQALVFSSGLVTPRPQDYGEYARPREIEIATKEDEGNAFRFRVELEDTPLLQFVNLPFPNPDVVVTVRSVYPGRQASVAVHFLGALVTDTASYVSGDPLVNFPDGLGEEVQLGLNDKAIFQSWITEGEQETVSYAYQTVGSRPLLRLKDERGRAWTLLTSPNAGRELVGGLVRFETDARGQSVALAYRKTGGELNLIDLSRRFDVRVSSFLKEGRTSYDASYATDLDLERPWAVRNQGGVGESLSVLPRAPATKLHALVVSNGYVSLKKPELYEQNSRARGVRITSRSPAFSLDVELRDDARLQFLALPLPTDNLTLTVLGVYPGTKYFDLCINFVAGLVTDDPTPQ